MSIPLVFAGIKTAIGAIAPTLGSVLSVGTTALNFVAQNAEAKNQNAAIDAANKAAVQQAASDYDQLAIRAAQETAAAGQKKLESDISTRKAVASATASASEAGISGLSVTSLLSDIYGQKAKIDAGVNQNIEAANQALRFEADGVGRSLKNTIGSRAKTSGPSLLGAALEAGTGVYDNYKERLRVKSALGD